METKYKRILLKLSGESLMGQQGYGIDPQRVQDYAEQVKEIVDAGVQVAIVIGFGMKTITYGYVCCLMKLCSSIQGLY